MARYKIHWAGNKNSAESWVVQPDNAPYTLVSELTVMVPLKFCPEDCSQTPKAWAEVEGELILENGKWLIK